MENITINKEKLLAAYRSANTTQKEFLKKLYGKEVRYEQRTTINDRGVLG